MIRSKRLVIAYSILIALNVQLLIPRTANAQYSIKDSTINVNMIMAQYALQFPAGDVSDRFGINSMIGGAYLYKNKTNWLFGLDGRFIFGSNVKDSDRILDIIETEDNNIVDMEGIYATYHLYERGFAALAKAGKLVTWGKPNLNSGILIGAGAGLLQHKILIDHRDKSAPQITGDYVKGYDELKRGPALNVFTGYLHLDNNRIMNFYAGFDLTIAFTQHVRPYSFSQIAYNSGNFTDIFLSLNVGWIIPVYKRAPKDFYYY